MCYKGQPVTLVQTVYSGPLNSIVWSVWVHLYMCFSKYILCCCCLVIQLCPTLYDPMGCSPPGSSVHGILQARILEWVPFPSPGSSQPRDWTCIFYVSCFRRQILYHWATSEAQAHLTVLHNLHLNPHIGKANSKVIYRCSAAWSVSAHNPCAVQVSTVLTLLHVHSWDLYLDKARQRQVLLLREKTAKNPEGWDKHLFLENVITASAGQVESTRWRSKNRMTRDAPRTVGHRQGPGGDLLTQMNTWAQRTHSTKATQQSAGDFWWMPTADPAFVCCAEKAIFSERSNAAPNGWNGSLGRRHVFLLPWEFSGETGRHRPTWTLGPGKIISNTQRKRKKTIKQFSG